MATQVNRREFLAQSAATAAAGGGLAFLAQLPPVSAADTQQVGNLVQNAPDIEPLVRLIETTERNRLLETIGAKIRVAGVSYQQVLAALMLAGVRGIHPKPVGFKFHGVLVINSAHQASVASPEEDRWLPVFWALDHFKSAQDRNKAEGDWRMKPVDEGRVPPATKARERLVAALDAWDEEAADVAAAGFARSGGAVEVGEVFWRYGIRDFRDIGHKAIYAANAWRTLQVIGWRHAEPIARSLALAMLDRGRDANPAQNDFPADRPYRENLKRITQIKPDWKQNKRHDEKAVNELLATLRTATASEAGEAVMKMLNQGVAPAAIWDALFLTASELLMRQPGIVGLHCVTATNGIYFAYEHSGDDETRRLAMLQNAAFLTLFREAMKSRGNVADVKVDKLEKRDLKATGTAALDEIFADLTKDKMAATQKTLAWLAQPNASAHDLLNKARQLIFLKGRDSHDYKFSSAALEDYYNTSPRSRNHFLAACMHWMKGSGETDNALVKRIRAALA
jgi:hypothetical protein